MARLVSFSSVITLPDWDETVANSKYLPSSTVNVVTDQEATLDVFHWSAFDGRINLASRTLSTQANKQVFAIGRFSSADTPAIKH